MKKDILKYVISNTVRETMDTVSTKEVANHFEIDTSVAFQNLNALAKGGHITKLDPLNSQNLMCCDWVRNNDLIFNH